MAVAAVYLAALLLSHFYVIAPRFAYRGMDFHPASIGILLLASLMAIIPTVWMPVQSSRPSTLTYFTLYFLLYIPACVVPICTLEYQPIRYVSYIICISFCFWLMSQIYNCKLIKLPRVRLEPNIFWAAFFIISIAINVAIVMRFGFSLQMPSLRGEIYELRYEYHDVLAGSLLVYFIALQAKILAPMLIIWGLNTSKPVLVLYGAFSQLLIFLNAGIKTVLFSTLFLIGLYYALKLSRRKIFISMAMVLIAVIGFSRIADKLFDGQEEVYFSSIFVRRMILTPGLLSGYYFDFFSDNPKSYYGHSILEGIVDYPYYDPPARIIATNYFNATEGKSNANFWADGYANIGIYGVLASSLLLAFILWLYDSIAMNIDSRVSTLLLAMPSLALVNSALFTVLITHGLVFAMVVLFFFPHRGNMHHGLREIGQSHIPLRQRCGSIAIRGTR